MTVLVVGVGGLVGVAVGSLGAGGLCGAPGRQVLGRHIVACPTRSARRIGGAGGAPGRQILGRHVVPFPTRSIRSPASASNQNGSLRAPCRRLAGPTTMA